MKKKGERSKRYVDKEPCRVLDMEFGLNLQKALMQILLIAELIIT